MPQLANERSERETIRGVQILADAVRIYILIPHQLGNGWCIKMIYPCCVGVIYPCFVGVINPAQFP